MNDVEKAHMMARLLADVTQGEELTPEMAVQLSQALETMKCMEASGTRQTAPRARQGEKGENDE